MDNNQRTERHPRVQLLEARLDSIAQNLKSSGQGLALLGLGSVGIETSRLDQWSDLDFFAIVRPGAKQQFINDRAWLESAAPVEYWLRNTADGFKFLYSDGVFCEMAVFEAHELASIPYSEGRIIWADQDFDPALRIPKNPGSPAWKPDSVEWCLGELITCLYVGLCRFRRGEKLSAWRFIQTFCVDRFLEIIALTQTPVSGFADYYSRDRRFELLYPESAGVLASVIQGYEKTPESALALLSWCEERFAINAAMAREILKLAQV